MKPLASLTPLRYTQDSRSVIPEPRQLPGVDPSFPFGHCSTFPGRLGGDNRLLESQELLLKESVGTSMSAYRAERRYKPDIAGRVPNKDSLELLGGRRKEQWNWNHK